MFGFSKKPGKLEKPPELSAEEAVFGAPQPASTKDQMPPALQEIRAQLLTMAHILLTFEQVEGDWVRAGDVEAMMALATDVATGCALGEVEGLRALMYAQKLIVDGGDTAVAYQLKKWGCRELPLEAKRAIIERGFLLATSGGKVSRAHLDALVNIARWIRLPGEEFEAVLRSARGLDNRVIRQ